MRERKRNRNREEKKMVKTREKQFSEVTGCKEKSGKGDVELHFIVLEANWSVNYMFCE